MVKTMPMMLKTRPTTAILRLVDFMPFSDMTNPTIVTGKPNSGISQPSIPMMPRTSPAVALPVGLSVGFGDVVFSIVCFVVGVSSGLTSAFSDPLQLERVTMGHDSSAGMIPCDTTTEVWCCRGFAETHGSVFQGSNPLRCITLTVNPP